MGVRLLFLPNTYVSLWLREDYNMDELEAEFLGLTNYLFEWKDCKTLISNEETISAKEVTLQEAIDLIKEGGYTPCPF